MPELQLVLDQVTQEFRVGRRSIRAVDHVSLAIVPGQVICLVGESGSGKTTTGKIAAGLLKPTAGSVRFGGQDIWQLDHDAFRRFRRAVQIIHQDPYASLNPVHTVYDTLAAPLQHHGLTRGQAATLRRVHELLTLVDLTPPENFLWKYPHQLSGGQRQRVAIARALTVQPQFIVADEATSMVDVSIRVSLLNTLRRLRDELGVGFLFITHDLAIAKYFGWEGSIAVMYLGRVVEIGPTPALINTPQHPYTHALLAAIPEPDPDLTRSKQKLQLRSLDIPSLLNIPPGCSFHPRCPLFEAGLCDTLVPDLVPLDRRRVACHIVAREHANGHALPPAAAGTGGESTALSPSSGLNPSG